MYRNHEICIILIDDKHICNTIYARFSLVNDLHEGKHIL